MPKIKINHSCQGTNWGEKQRCYRCKNAKLMVEKPYRSKYDSYKRQQPYAKEKLGQHNFQGSFANRHITTTKFATETKEAHVFGSANRAASKAAPHIRLECRPTDLNRNHPALRAAPDPGWALRDAGVRAVYGADTSIVPAIYSVAMRPPLGRVGRGPCWSHGRDRWLTDPITSASALGFPAKSNSEPRAMLSPSTTAAPGPAARAECAWRRLLRRSGVAEHHRPGAGCLH